MLATLITAALLSVPATVQLSDDPANLLPADTLMYFGTHSVQDGRAASANSAMHLILNEPEVKAFLTRPVSAADAFLQQMLKEADVTDVDPARLSVSDMMFGTSGDDGAPIGRVFMALTHVSLPEPGPDASPVPDIGLVAGLELLESDDLALIKGLWSRIELPEQVSNHNGHEVLLKSTPEGVDIGLAFVGNLAVASMSQKTLHAVIDRSAGGSSAGNSLGASVDYQSLLKTSGGLQAGASSFMLRVGPIFELCRGSLGMGLLMSAEADTEEAMKVMQALDGLGLDALHWVGGVSHRELSGEVISTSVTSADTSGAGLIPSLLRDDSTFDLARLETVPGNVMAMSAWSIDWLPKIYDFAMRTFEALAPDEHAEVQGMISGFMGDSNLRDDLLANVHGMLMSYTLPGEGFPGTPTSVSRVGLHDGDAFKTAVNNLFGAVGGMLGSPLELKEVEHENVAFYELDISRTPLAMSMMQPAFAIDGDQLVYSIESAKTLKTALNSTVSAPDSLASNKGLMAFARDLSSNGRVTTLKYSDNAKTFGAFYGQVAGAAQMMAGAAGDLPVDLALMPSEQAIAKHLGESFGGGYVTSDGKTLVTHSVSQFELGDFIPILCTGGIVAASMFAADGAHRMETIEEIDPQEQVQRDLADIRAGMTVYKLSEDRYPSSIADLVQPVPDYPDGFLGRSEAPVDPWGNGYLYRLNERGKPFLWSAGPNGIDDGGQGDDLVIKKGY
jgi:hypothetical protein